MTASDRHYLHLHCCMQCVLRHIGKLAWRQFWLLIQTERKRLRQSIHIEAL